METEEINSLYDTLQAGCNAWVTTAETRHFIKAQVRKLELSYKEMEGSVIIVRNGDESYVTMALDEDAWRYDVEGSSDEDILGALRMLEADLDICEANIIAEMEEEGYGECGG